MVYGLGYRVKCLRFGVKSKGFGGLGLRIEVFGFRIQGLRCNVKGAGFTVWVS
jgi:hypothetical protein